jgi:serine/threonine protein kinase
MLYISVLASSLLLIMCRFDPCSGLRAGSLSALDTSLASVRTDAAQNTWLSLGLIPETKKPMSWVTKKQSRIMSATSPIPAIMKDYPNGCIEMKNEKDGGDMCLWKLMVIEKALKKGGFILTGLLGAGGFASVFEVKSGKKSERLAAKVTKAITPTLCNDWTCVEVYEGLFMKQAKKEFDIMKALEKTGIVLKAHELIEDVYPMTNMKQKYPIVIMEKLKMDLVRYVDQLPQQDKTQTLAFVKSIVDTVITFHKNGYVHHDIKLDNFGMSESGKIVLLDFGAAINTSGMPAPERSKKRAVDVSSIAAMLQTLSANPKFTGIKDFKVHKYYPDLEY